MEYDFKKIETEWQAYWAKHKTFAAKDGGDKPKYYVLDMFPYPSGAGLHVGHPLGYIASDIVARFKRHKGFNVLHPMGYDSFGLPAEQYAIQTGQHPKITTENNIAVYRKQLDKIGFSFDWDREVRTSNPEYYKWTQWIFIQIFNSWYNKNSNKAENISTLIAEFETNGNASINACCDENVKSFTATDWKGFSEKEQSDILMAYRIAYLGEAYVNWCPQLGTVLANDEIKDGVSERGGYPVERKLMKQWSMRITAYSQRLLDGLDTLDWTESLKDAQRNWIGKSVGTSLRFKIQPFDSAQGDKYIEVFTTRPDTIFGVSFVTLAPEHELVETLTTADNKAAVEEYVTIAKNRSERERQADIAKITGVFTGSYVEHPFTGKQVPIWIGDYVLAGYGTGAVMAVPAHDSRDYSFAKHFGLPILEVVEGTSNVTLSEVEGSYDAKEGNLINSDFLNGLDVKDAMKKAIAEIEARGLGKGKVNFRLRDAVFGRQRYWGEPIPVYYKNDIPYALNESELPLVLPEVDKYLPTEDGEPPLARAASSWKHEGKYDYEHSTMPGWAGSSWYFLRYMDPHNNGEFASKNLTDYWKQVDLYIGGSEHATGHLLYVRFWTKFLKDLGHIAIDEPAKKLINQGMIQGVSTTVRQFFCKKISLNLNAPNKKFDIIDDAKYNILGSFDKFKSGQTEYNGENFYREGYSVVNMPIEYCEIDPSNSYAILRKETVIKVAERDPRFKITFENFDIEKNVFWDNDEKYGLHLKLALVVEKMSKSKFNVISPDSNFNEVLEKEIPGMVNQFGADTLRLYEMFLGPLEQSKPWNTNGITGVHGFLKKLWRLFYATGEFVVSTDEPTKHKTIKKITEDIERFSFNTSISNFMICVNELTDAKCNKRAILEPLLICLSPYAPHIAEELWKQLGHNESISLEPFPEFNEEYLVDDSVNYPISFNGKVKFTLELAATLTKEEVEAIAMSHENMVKYLEGKTPKKIIVVHKKIVNVVV
jgi:leucyl-tRNA synthetase